MKKFITKIVIASIVLTVAGSIAFTLLFPEYYLPVLPVLLILFVIASITIHSWQVRMSKKDLNKFARTNMMATMLRLVIYSTIAIIYIVNKPENALVFVICLMTFYLVFTIIEVADLSRVIKNNKKDTTSSK